MKKDYLRLFISHCNKHDIWFAVCADSSIYECTHTELMIDFLPDHDHKIGSKKCYDWLVRQVAIIESSTK